MQLNINSLNWKVSRLKSEVHRLESENKKMRRELKIRKAKDRWQDNTFLTPMHKKIFIKG